MWPRRLVMTFATMSAAVGVGLSVLAWRGRSSADLWHGVTPSWWTFGFVSPRSVAVGSWRRTDYDPSLAGRQWRAGPYLIEHARYTPDEQRHALQSEVRVARGHHSWGGFGWLYGNKEYPPLDRSFGKAWAPTWAAILAAMTPPVVVGATAVRRRRRGARAAAVGCCRRCGYDLRASPERCPECGAAGQNR